MIKVLIMLKMPSAINCTIKSTKASMGDLLIIMQNGMLPISDGENATKCCSQCSKGSQGSSGTGIREVKIGLWNQTCPS